jgi:aspartate aminotransferase
MNLSSRLDVIQPSATLSINAKAKELMAQGIKVINFAVGEPDFDTPDHICRAAKAAIDEGFHRYTAVPGMPALRAAVAQRIEEDYGLSYTPEEVVVSTGGKHTLYNLAQALFDPGDEVIVPAPYWVSYPDILALAGAKSVVVPALEENGFKITREQLEDAITGKTKGILLNSPSNPTGSVYSRAELEGLAEPIVEHDITVISDDVYYKLLYDGLEFACLAQLGEELKKRTVIASAVSKTYAMTGWRIGYMLGPENVAKAVSKLQSQSTSNTCSIAQKAALAALTGPQETVDEMAQAFDKRRLFVIDRIAKIEGVTMPRPQGAFYAFPNVSAHFGKSTGDSVIAGSIDMAQYLMEDAHVAVVPGAPFGEDTCIRLSFAASMEMLVEALDRIDASLKKLV